MRKRYIFLELGKEIEDILAKIHGKKETEIAVTINKKHLDRKKWEAGMEMLGRKTEWERFSQKVLTYHSQKAYPKVCELFTISAQGCLPEVAQVKLGEQTWYGLSRPLKDVSKNFYGQCRSF